MIRGARFMVDGMNVIGCRPDGWWRDRPGATRSLVERLSALSRATGDQVVVVLDGRPTPLPSPGLVVVEFAGTGRDAADRLIADRLAVEAAPSEVTVVTSDAALRRAALALGASVMSATAFRARLDLVAEPCGAPAGLAPGGSPPDVGLRPVPPTPPGRGGARER